MYLTHYVCRNPQWSFNSRWFLLRQVGIPYGHSLVSDWDKSYNYLVFTTKLSSSFISFLTFFELLALGCKSHRIMIDECTFLWRNRKYSFVAFFCINPFQNVFAAIRHNQSTQKMNHILSAFLVKQCPQLIVIRCKRKYDSKKSIPIRWSTFAGLSTWAIEWTRPGDVFNVENSRRNIYRQRRL